MVQNISDYSLKFIKTQNHFRNQVYIIESVSMFTIKRYESISFETNEGLFCICGFDEGNKLSDSQRHLRVPGMSDKKASYNMGDFNFMRKVS